MKSYNSLCCLLAIVALSVAGLSRGDDENITNYTQPNHNLRPEVRLTAGPQLPDTLDGVPVPDSVFYNVTFAWTSHDDDGSVSHHIYAVDPAWGDTTWTTTVDTTVTLIFRSTTPESPLPSSHPVASSDFHVFVVKAVDNEGLESAPAFRAFKTFTVAPQGRITSPIPSLTVPFAADTALTIVWEGDDPDGVMTQTPIEYAVKLALLEEVQGALGLGEAEPTVADIQKYFLWDAPAFTAWERIDSDTPTKTLLGLLDDSEYYFAVVTFDEASAYDPLFSLDRNVLHFRTEEATQVEARTWGRVKAERR
jgi:hypothetical protein